MSKWIKIAPETFMYRGFKIYRAKLPNDVYYITRDGNTQRVDSKAEMMEIVSNENAIKKSG